MNKRHKTKKGFTLIELLVVVLIIGILAAIALPKYQLAVAKSRYAELMTLGKALKYSQEAFFLANGRYATNIEELDIELPSHGTVNPGGTVVIYANGTIANINHQGRGVAVYNYTLLSNNFEIFFDKGNESAENRGRALCYAAEQNNLDFGRKLCEAMGAKDSGGGRLYWL